MASVQAAAALFASDDAEDPFASLGAEPASQNHEHPTEAGPTGGAKGLVDNSASFFDEQLIAEQPSTTAGPESGGRPYTERATSYSYTPTAHNAGYQQNYQSHPNGTEQQVPAALNNAQSVERQDPKDPYDRYATSSTPSYVAPTQPAQTASHTPSQYNYTPAPAAPQSAYNYAPTTPAHSATPYAPPAPALLVQPSVPVVPKPSAPPIRPKVSNAYDPPFSVVPTRRAASQGRSHQAYNPYTPSSPPPPLPPLPSLGPGVQQNAYQTTASTFAPPFSQPARPPSSASSFSALPPPPRPLSSTSGFVHPFPPRPSSSTSSFRTPPPLPPPASTSSLSHPPPRQPPNSAAFGAHPPPPRPPSSTSGYNAQYQHGHPQRPPSSASNFTQAYPGRSPSSASTHSTGQYQPPLPPPTSAVGLPPRPPSTASNFSHPPRPPSSTASHHSYSSNASSPSVYKEKNAGFDAYASHEALNTSTVHGHALDSVDPEEYDPEGGGDWEMDQNDNNRSRTLTPQHEPVSLPVEEASPSHDHVDASSGGLGYPSSAYPYPHSGEHDGLPVGADTTQSEDIPSSASVWPTTSPVAQHVPHDAPPSDPYRAASPRVNSMLPPPAPSAAQVSQAPPPPTGYSYRPSSSASMGRATSPLSEQPPTSNRYRPASAASVRSPPTHQAPPPPPAEPYAPRRQLSNGHVVDNVYNVGYATKPPLNAIANSYVPLGAPPPPRNDENRVRSMSNGSTLSINSTGSQDRYAPVNHTRAQTSESDYGSYTSRYDFPNAEATLGEPAPPTRAPYAPSPSLMGTNDPLGRASARVPVFSFGFGGKVVTCFHGASRMTAGFDVALSSRISTGIDIRVLNKIIPESALDTNAAFPGPLFGDGGGPTAIGLVRPGAATQAKNRKNKVLTYLTDRITEIGQGIGYLHQGSIDKRRADGKLILAKLLKVMVEFDGRLSGTPEIDAAVRYALVPHLEGMPDDTATPGFLPLQRVGSLSGLPPMDSSEVIATTTLHASALDKIQNFLLRGQRKQAYNYALDQQLWAHAMVIASGIDKESWQEVVKEFIKTELGVKSDPARLGLQAHATDPLPPSINGREGLRAVYGLFSGQGVTSVQELVPQNLLARATSLAVQMPTKTPLTPNFPGAAPAGNIPPEALSNWAETVCMMLSTTITSELSTTLLTLGDQLFANHWVEAAHVCYLLSSQTLPSGGTAPPPIGGIGNPSARMVLVGSRNPQSFPIFYKDPDALIFTEIIEFALSLPTPPKGQEPFSGLPHLQAYRFIRAAALAELGYISETSRYCEAITPALARPSPYFNDVLLELLKGLSDRLAGVAPSDKNTWIAGKLGKPSLDSIGGWLEGRFTKLVTGDVDSPGLPVEDTARPDGPGFSNTFSQYSTISSAAPSASPSPQSSVVNLLATSNYRPTDRSASALDNRRKQSLPPPRIASASAATTSFAQAYSLGQALNSYQPMSTTSEDTPRVRHDEVGDDDPDTQVVTWWGDIDSHRTPTAANFVRADNVSLVPTGDGFVSPMGNFAFGGQPANSTRSYQPSNTLPEEEEDEDLGFGNSKSKPKKDGDAPYDPGNVPKTSDKKQTEAKPAERPDPKPMGNNATAASGSWFGRWFKKSDGAPAPVKASLGEETSFYYDKELKKWVNKKAGSDDAAKTAPPPPPPSRPQTASPGMTGPRQGLTNGTAGPPPARSASAMDLTSPPKRAIPRARSNLAPTPESEAQSMPVTPPPPSTTPGLAPPPSPMPGRPKSSASKRPIRNRYVDVFAQGGGAGAAPPQ